MDHHLIHQLTDAQINDLHALYQNEWWTRGRELEDIRQMLAHSDCVFGVEDDRTCELLAFARVLTDRTYKALIFDVIVAPYCRDHGLGKLLMEAILGHPDLAQVRHFELYCLPEMAPFYERWHFTTEVSGVQLMRLDAL